MIYQEDFRSKEFYMRKLQIAIPQMAECLALGYQIEVAPSRGGVKVYSVGKKHIKIVGIREQEGAEFKAEENAMRESRGLCGK